MVLAFELRTDKCETYSGEAVDADLRHYMKRLARMSGYFSRKALALQKHEIADPSECIIHKNVSW